MIVDFAHNEAGISAVMDVAEGIAAGGAGRTAPITVIRSNGTASGVGRLGAIAGPILGGALLQAGIAYPWGFYAFAVVAALGALGVVLVGRAPSPT